MKNHLLQSAFLAAQHAPTIGEYLHGLRLHFNNYSSVTVRPSLHKALIKFKVSF